LPLDLKLKEIDMLSPSAPTILLDQGAADATRYAPILVPNVLSIQECCALITEMVKHPPEPTPVLRAGRDNFEPSVRLSDSCVPSGPMRLHALSRVENAAQTHWPHDPDDPSTISAAHYFRYPKGGFVAPHRDRSPNNDDPREVRWRKASLVLFLNSGEPPDGFEGGALVIYVPQVSGPTITHTIRAQTGTLVLFEPGLMHEVTPVRSGARYTLVAWLIASN
jgi:hypothetical protein